MISIREVFLKEEINSIDDITEQERMNLNAYLLDYFSLCFKDVYSKACNTVLQNAIIRSVKSIDILLQMINVINKNKESFKDAVIFQQV